MSHRHKPTHDPHLDARMQKLEKRDRRVEHMFRRVLHIVERIIATITIIALLAALGLEIYQMFTMEGYFREVNHVLHNLLSIVVGLEFVRMLIDTTPANILEVLTVAITRHVVLTHEDPLSNIASVACIAGLFAIRRYLIRRSELKEEMVEIE